MSQDHQRADIPVLGYESQPRDNAAQEWFTTHLGRLRAAFRYGHLHGPERRQNEHGGLRIVRAVGPDEGNKDTGKGRAHRSRHVEGHGVECQGIHQVPGPDDVADQRLARRLLERLDCPGQKASHIHVPGLHAMQQHQGGKNHV